MKTNKKALYEDCLEQLKEMFRGEVVISALEASHVLRTNVEVVKREEGLNVFKVGGRYKVALTSLARFMTGGE